MDQSARCNCNVKLNGQKDALMYLWAMPTPTDSLVYYVWWQPKWITRSNAITTRGIWSSLQVHDCHASWQVPANSCLVCTYATQLLDNRIIMYKANRSFPASHHLPANQPGQRSDICVVKRPERSHTTSNDLALHIA